MHRTNIYLTEHQERAIAARARRQGKSRSEVIREILDRDLRDSRADRDVVKDLAALADSYHERVRGLFDDDPDLRIDS